MKNSTRITKIDLFKAIYNDPDRKPIFKIVKELFSLTIHYKALPRHYFSRYLFKKDKVNIKDYFPTSFLDNKIKFVLNDQAVIEVLENKLYFNFFYSQFKIGLPKILMYNHKKMFVVGGKSFEINNGNDFKNHLENLFKNNPSHDSIIIKKSYWSYGGANIYKLFPHQLKKEPEKINELYSKIIKAGFLFQETVKQHAELDKLNPSCLNTIRFDTFIDKDGKIEIISAFIRMSTTNSFVDNISSGGCFVGINLENGKLKKEGYPTLVKGVEILTFHPITNTVFENFNIPFFEEAKKLIIRTASYVPGLRIIGWDVAIGQDGPVLIEGNSNYAMNGNDLAIGGYGSNAIFRKLFKKSIIYNNKNFQNK